MMKIYYYSMTGNTESFLKRSTFTNYENITSIEDVNEPFIIATGTVNYGEVPLPVDNFLSRHSKYLKGVISSGNRNWGENFAKAGDVIAEKYNVPLIMKFELRGGQKELNQFNERMEKFEKVQSH